MHMPVTNTIVHAVSGDWGPLECHLGTLRAQEWLERISMRHESCACSLSQGRHVILVSAAFS